MSQCFVLLHGSEVYQLIYDITHALVKRISKVSLDHHESFYIVLKILYSGLVL